MTITEALAAEHTVFLNLFEQIERVLPGCRTVGQVRLLASVVEGLLESHADAETNLAYRALDHLLADQNQLDRLHHDHREIDARLEDAQSTRSLTEARRLLTAAIEVSRAHFDHEESSVFPFLERMLARETLRDLGKSRLQRKPELIPA